MTREREKQFANIQAYKALMACVQAPKSTYDYIDYYVCVGTVWVREHHRNRNNNNNNGKKC